MCTRSISVQREFSLLFSCHLQLHNFRGRGETGDEKIRLPNLTSTYYVTVKNFFNTSDLNLVTVVRMLVAPLLMEGNQAEHKQLSCFTAVGA